MRFVEILRHCNIRFHLTGAITGMIYSEPRLTEDADFVVDPVRLKAVAVTFVNELGTAGFYFDESIVSEAIREGRLFQLLDSEESLKLDVYPRELIRHELDRSESAEVFEGVTLPIVCRSDAALSKLIWVSKGSGKSRRDLRLIYQSSSRDVQIDIRSAADEMGLSDLLTDVLSEPNEIE